MQLRDRWWYHTLLKGTVRDTLASYGSVPESGPPLSFDQGVLEPTCPPFLFLGKRFLFIHSLIDSRFLFQVQALAVEANFRAGKEPSERPCASLIENLSNKRETLL
jgi:hypothetical protein